ncbi:hypothetical protein HDU81_002609 [Chytriomyces hyalinus]|nr:hypothetical protein HDU81_002609 [Chytriomyces hyalinus]
MSSKINHRDSNATMTEDSNASYASKVASTADNMLPNVVSDKIHSTGPTGFEPTDFPKLPDPPTVEQVKPNIASYSSKISSTVDDMLPAGVRDKIHSSEADEPKDFPQPAEPPVMETKPKENTSYTSKIASKVDNMLPNSVRDKIHSNSKESEPTDLPQLPEPPVMETKPNDNTSYTSKIASAVDNMLPNVVRDKIHSTETDEPTDLTQPAEPPTMETNPSENTSYTSKIASAVDSMLPNFVRDKIYSTGSEESEPKDLPKLPEPSVDEVKPRTKDIYPPGLRGGKDVDIHPVEEVQPEPEQPSLLEKVEQGVKSLFYTET